MFAVFFNGNILFKFYVDGAGFLYMLELLFHTGAGVNLRQSHSFNSMVQEDIVHRICTSEHIYLPLLSVVSTLCHSSLFSYFYVEK